jgi:alpha-galactosidase/6-phospho-beta-glucosidase family protein
LTSIRACIIGAGSATFSMNLVRDLCLKDSLRGSTVCFMDVDKDRLDVVYDLASRFAIETEADFKFEKTLERCRSHCRFGYLTNRTVLCSRLSLTGSSSMSV